MANSAELSILREFKESGEDHRELYTDISADGSSSLYTESVVRSMAASLSSKPLTASSGDEELGHSPSIPPRPTTTKKKVFDTNLYATKKTIAKGMLDISLLSSNASQIKQLLETEMVTIYQFIALGLLITSLIGQILIGVGLIIVGRYNINEEESKESAEKVNNWIVVGIFVITVVNVLASAFH